MVCLRTQRFRFHSRCSVFLKTFLYRSFVLLCFSKIIHNLGWVIGAPLMVFGNLLRYIFQYLNKRTFAVFHLYAGSIGVSLTIIHYDHRSCFLIVLLALLFFLCDKVLMKICVTISPRNM
jgi:hypothetical protein